MPELTPAPASAPADLATELIKQLLAARSPELGARLKQRLIASLREQGLPSFNEKALGYKSFQAFLERIQGNWLLLTRPESGPGDIQVSLKAPLAAPILPAGEAISQFRNEVWQAFTNPDPSRKRFLHRRSGDVLHFKSGEQSQEEVTYSANKDDYIEVEFIGAERQRAWMEEFLNSVPVVGSERQAYESLISGAYSSALNAAFTRALGDKQEQWRQFRTSRVAHIISDWAVKNAVPVDELSRPSQESNLISGHAIEARSPKEDGSARRNAIALLELLSEREIQNVVLPVMLSTMLMRSRV